MADTLPYIDGAQCIPSEFCDDRPDQNDVSVLVIHNISLPPGQFGGQGIEQLFTGCIDPNEHPFYAQICGLRVSSHLAIRRDGQLQQFVPLMRRAWHAGVSSFQGRARCNDYSIGIELEGTDTAPYTDEQYRCLIDISVYIIEQYPSISLGRIVGHNDIAPGRKTDPGPAFDWARYRVGLVNALRARSNKDKA